MRIRSSWVPGFCLTLLTTSSAWTLPGAHGPAISTFDTRGSTVVLAYREGFSSDAAFREASYNANFSATGGNFSAQFGAHYIQMRDIPNVDLAHGAGATGVGLFSIPVASRFENGVPKLAIDLYAGATPTVAVSGSRNFFTAPLVVGFGVSMAPAHWFTLTPWVEVGPGVNWDTFIDSEGLVFMQQTEVLPDGTVQVRSPDVNEALAEAVDSRFSIEVPARAGLLATMHLGETWDFQLTGDYITFGSLFGGASIISVGAGLGFHWDDVVPAVLPARKRLSHESCEDVEARFVSCPRYRELEKAAGMCPVAPAPVQGQPPPATPSEPASSPPPAPSQPAPAPPTPQPAPPSVQPPPPPPPPPPPAPDPFAPPQGAFPLP